MTHEDIKNAINICLGHGKCEDCCYHSTGFSDQNCRGRMLRDVLKILEKQVPKLIEYNFSPVCSTCKMAVADGDSVKFCCYCGQAIKFQ